MAKKVGVLVGSLRKESYSRQLAKALMTLAPVSWELEEVELGQLAIYNQDFDDEGTPPSAWIAFRECVKNFDAILFVTPEYNRSVPAVLKNALDVGSRPYGQNIWDGKPGAVVSVSQGGLSGFGANHHLRQTLVFLNVPTMQQPEAYIGNAATLFDANGDIANDGTREFLQKFMAAFAVWVETNAFKKG
ncbi:Quinone reductase [bioreactor metagenome]|uniref:Quinone reductase n=1 Tax=bioreactor metagenome TaxID=1076179 RepID=A0A645DNG9_9ZZZZ